MHTDTSIMGYHVDTWDFFKSGMSCWGRQQRSIFLGLKMEDFCHDEPPIYGHEKVETMVIFMVIISW